VSSAAVTWGDVVRVTAQPLWYAVPLAAVALLFGREMLISFRGTRSIALSTVTALLTVAGFAIVTARLLALTR
jgi:hypothetical protein